MHHYAPKLVGKLTDPTIAAAVQDALTDGGSIAWCDQDWNIWVAGLGHADDVPENLIVGTYCFGTSRAQIRDDLTEYRVAISVNYRTG